VDGVRAWPAGWIAAVTILSCAIAPASEAHGLDSAQKALDASLNGANAVVVVLDGQDGRTIAAASPERSTRVAETPGSVLKPFFLAAALGQGKVRAETASPCRGNLHIAGRNVACTHPRSETVFDAERALAWSCNEWFARLALRFAPQQAVDVLRAYGFGNWLGLTGEQEWGTVRKPESEAELQLLVLGLDGVKVTPAQLARAYFRLGQQLYQFPTVRRGLLGSISYGMAHNAATAAVTIAGKTGTASDPGEAWTHGWFAGIAERGHARVVVAILVPRGNGADAALMAHRFFALWERTATQ